MLDIAPSLNPFNPSSVDPRQGVKKHHRLIGKTWHNNTNSDYTEKIKELGQKFSYKESSDHYWCNPELSLLYGTPLYEVASEPQKIALNHLYWLSLYQGVAATEIGAVIYNQIAAGVFAAMGGYETLCQELALETEQEKIHIRAFQKICSKVQTALLGKTLLGNSRNKKLPRNRESGLAIDYQYYALRFLAQSMLRNYRAYYSPYLKNLEKKGKSIPVPTHGVIGKMTSLAQLKFLTINFGISPFLACQSFTIRFASNILIKAQENCYSKYFFELSKRGEVLPIPTAVSRYHFLDESFHMTISQALSLELHKDFPQPNAYEKFVANHMFYNMQRNLMGGLSGVFPGRCVQDDCNFMLLFYKVLQSPVFGMSQQDALHWLEKCFCTEHEGFHVTLKYHKRLLLELRRTFKNLDYLWPVNREMQLLNSGASIDKAIANNLKTFEQFKVLISKSI